MSGDPIVAVPADLELEDRLVGPITFRMAGWLAAAAAGVALLALAREQLWTVGPGLLLVTVGLAGALWQPGGRPAPAWVGPLWSYRRRARVAADRNIAAPEPAVVLEPEPVAQPAPDVDDAWKQDLPAAERFGRFRRARPALVVGMAMFVLALVAVVAPIRLTDRAWWGRTVVTSTDASPSGGEGSSGPMDTDAPGRPAPTGVQPPQDAPVDPQPGVPVPVDPLELWLDEHHDDQIDGGWSGCGC